jgi:glutaminyl-tRNA synthetase
LRAKIDMASPNFNLRDPVMYRILHAEHHRTGNKWCIYPMYDFAHGQSDSIERVTHSLCTLEFEDHRPLYNWFIQQLGIFPSQQIEFDRLNLTYTLLSKRKLLQLVQEGRVSGWDDPRMPTLGGIRRRGYTPEAIRNFVRRYWRIEDQWFDRTGHARALRPRRPEQALSTRDGGAASAEGCDRQLSGESGRRDGCGE